MAPGPLSERHIVKYEGDAIFFTQIHHTVFLLIVDLVRLTHFEWVWFTLDGKLNARVSCNRNVDSMTHMERTQVVAVGANAPPGLSIWLP